MVNMYGAKITLTPVGPIADEEDAIQRLWDYFRVLYKNGQILDNYEVIRADTGFMAFVTMTADDALDEKYGNVYVRDYLERVEQIFVVSSEILGENVNHDDGCVCERPSWYFLEATFFQSDSPVLCGDCGETRSLVTLPHLFDEDEHYSILGWVDAYNCVNKLWFEGLWDRFTSRQLGQADSQLSKWGLEICGELEKLTGARSYYALWHRTLTPPVQCPVCGSVWLPVKVGERTFVRCEGCRLVSETK